VTFSEVQLPAAKWEDYVEVLGTHEMGAFFHISKANDNLKGQLFVSDKSGIVFTLSLDNHLYHRYNGWRTSLYVNDFYEVKSMRGVYITSIELSNGAHYSMITFNNGGSWQKLIPPTGSCTSCSLHLHLSYSKTVNYNLNTLPLSTSNAVGMIIAHGTVGLSRNYASDNVNIVTSKDGGYTWTMHSQLNGTFSYGIGNYGNIMAIVRSGTIESSGTLWFSHDRGLCFQNEEIDTTSAFKLSKGFIMDPKGLGMYAFAIGLEGTEINDNWKLIAIDFNSVLDSTCHSNDYMTVTEHNVSNTCILGYKRQYRITKPTSICKNDASYSPLPVKTIRCNCSYSDMECDFGFKRSQGSNGKFTCAPDKSFNLSALCPPNQEYYDRNIAGFRLIAGDMCISTPETDALLKVVRTKCTGHENNSGTSNYVFNSHKVLAVIVGVLFILAAVIILAALVIYIIIYCRRRDTLINDRVVYKRIPLNDEESSCQSSDSDEDLLN
jgi:sortilin